MADELGMRVLIVDDQVDVAAMLEQLVSAWGFTARVAHTGAEAVRIGEEFRPRVVLLDLALPDQYGYEVAMELRLRARRRRLFFIAVTGFSQIADQLRSAVAGVKHH